MVLTLGGGEVSVLQKNYLVSILEIRNYREDENSNYIRLSKYTEESYKKYKEKQFSYPS